MKDQIKKIRYLIRSGRNLEPRQDQEVAKRLGIKGPAFSAFASENAKNSLPDHHDAGFGEIFGFDPHCWEWRQGSFEEFKAHYEANTGGSVPQRDDHAAHIRAMLADLRKLPGLGNIIGALSGHADAAIEAARGMPDDMDDEDLLALFELQHELDLALAGRPVDNASGPISEALAAFRKLLQGLRDRLNPDEPVDLSDEMRRHLQTALEEVEKLLQDPDTDPNAEKALNGLRRTLNLALGTGQVTLAILDRWSRIAETRLAARFRTGARAIMLCIGAAGRAGGKLPDRAVFVDSEDPHMPEMVVIPAGRFTMGSPEGEEGRSGHEGPQRDVRVPRFALCRNAVTFAQYDAYCAATGTEPPYDEGWAREDHPVINVSWKDAQAFVRWLNEQVPRAPYRLPREAEWEYACRAGSDTPFEPNVAQKHRGQSIEPDEANFDGNFTYGAGAKGPYRERTVSVMHADFRANRWGLWQMHGNVWEWCEDVYGKEAKGVLPDEVVPPPNDDDASSQRVLRGGSWGNSPRNLRSACRNGNGPDLRVRYVGFRLARTLAP